MGKHLVNLFEITNLSDLECKYKLFEIENLPKDENYDKNINLLSTNLSYELNQPNAIIKRGDNHFIALPTDSPSPKLEQQIVPHVIKLKPENKEYKFNLSDLTSENLHIATKFLQFYFNSPLMKNYRKLWRRSSQNFFEKVAINANEKDRDIDVFRGFKFRIVPYNDKLYLALDLTYKYVDRYFITHYVKDNDYSNYLRKHFMYFFGDRWYQIQLWNVTGLPINKQKFQDPATKQSVDVYSYTKEKCKDSRAPYMTNLNPNTPAIVYRYPGRSQDRYGSISLCRRTYPTYGLTDRKLHSKSINKPEERFRIITKEILPKYFSNITFNDKPVKISFTPLVTDKNQFKTPNIVFGDNSVLRVGDSSGEVRLDCLGRERLKYIYEKGLYKDNPFDAQYFVVPQSLHRSISEFFYNKLCETIQKFSSHPYQPDLIIYDDEKTPTLLKQREAIENKFREMQINRGYALLVLPFKAKDKLHDHIKKRLWEEFGVKCQCAMAEKLSSYFYRKTHGDKVTYTLRYGKEGQFTSYVKHLSLGVIIINNNWPWMLKDALNCDVHIGVDVLNNCAGFTFYYNNPKLCYFYLSPSMQTEKLPSKQMKNVIYNRLKNDLSKHNIEPNAIVLHRDGRSFYEEHMGFKQAIKKLVSEGIIKKDTHTSIVDIHKTSLRPLRIVEDNKDKFENPTVGSYFVLNENEGMVLTTGKPFLTQGTAQPLDINIHTGDIKIEPILEDIFSLSQLIWSAPDKCSRVPITIKLADEFLRPIAAVTDEEDIYAEDENEYEEMVVNK
jgi:hypothetical protein